MDKLSRVKLLLLVSDNTLITIRGAKWLKPWSKGPVNEWKKGIAMHDYQKGRAKKLSFPKNHLTLVADYLKPESELTPEEKRSIYKERGIAPARPWYEKSVFIGCSTQVIDPFIPPEGDGKASILSKDRAAQEYKKLASKAKNFRAISKIRAYYEYFEPVKFAEDAVNIYKKALTALMNRDKDEVLKYVTEKCYPEMVRFAELKTIKWNYIKAVEPPYIVHTRCLANKQVDFKFAQVTLRLHSQQTLAVYDRFGRLIHGDEAAVKNVLEYIVFETQLNNLYGSWRIHGKIVPSWLPEREPARATFPRPEFQDIPDKVETSEMLDDDEVSQNKAVN